MIVIYAEKPDMGTKIAAALDSIHLSTGENVSFSQIERYEKKIKAQRTKDGYFSIWYDGQPACVIWGYGHMCELKQAKDIDPAYAKWTNIPLPYIPQSYDLKLSEGMEKQYSKICNVFARADKIICATDNDREGDLIMDYLCSYMGCHVPYYRAIYNEQSQDSFKKAFLPKNLVPLKDRMPVVYAGRARSAGDFLVGSGLTVAMTLKYPGNHVLSVGRVQTAVLEMIVQREKEIQSFHPEDYYVIKGTFTTDIAQKYQGIHISKRFPDKEKVKTVFQKLTDSGYVESVKQERYKKKKPYLYNLATLQMDANKRFGLSLSDTLEIVQKLYDGGYTTYPRTDSMFLPDDMGPEMKKVLYALQQTDLYAEYDTGMVLDISDKHYFDSSKVESHYAIVPTTKIPRLSGMEQKIYDLIVRSVLCMVYPEAELSKTTIITDVNGEKFVSTGTMVIDPGYMKVTGMPKESVLPCLSEGDNVSAAFQTETKQTEPPKRYTDATLLNAMINCGKTLEDEELRKLMAGNSKEQPKGLGRPSSQASIVKTLESRGYTTKNGKAIVPTQKGMLMMESFPVEDLKSAVMTAQWEKRLDDIEHGKDSYESFMNDLENAVRKWTMQIIQAPVVEKLRRNNQMETPFRCPRCGKPLNLYAWGYGCSGHTENTCDFHVTKEIAGVTIPEREFELLFNNGRTNIIRNFVSKTGKRFDAALQYNPETDKLEFSFENTTEYTCPNCSRKLEETPKTYVCEGKKDGSCDFIFWKKVYEKILPASVVKQLLTKGSCGPVSGLKSKTGKTFQAPLRMDKTGKVTIDNKECDIQCPVCNKNMNEFSWGFACSDRNACGFFIGKMISGYTVTEEDIKELAEKGITQEREFFSEKKQKKFYAKLELDRKEKKIKFKYDNW